MSIPWADFVSFAVEAARPHFPPPPAPQVVHWSFTTGSDTVGDSAVWITIVLQDASADVLHATANHVRRAIRDSLREQGIAALPYVRFLTLSQYQQSAAG